MQIETYQILQKPDENLVYKATIETTPIKLENGL